MRYAPSGWDDIPAPVDHGVIRRKRIADARAKGTHTDRDWEIMQAICKYRCVMCGSDEVRLTRDHVVPVFAGGCDCIANIQPLCGRCNSAKGAPAEDFRPANWSDLHIATWITINNALWAVSK